MKKPVILEVNGKKYTFLFTNRSLAMVERSIGRSILSILNGNQFSIIRDMTIEVTAASIKYGMQELGQKDPYDVIDEICDDGGLLDHINEAILEAWFNTGIFFKWAGTPAPQEMKATEERAPVKKRRKENQ